MTRVRHRRSRARLDVLDHMQWFELMLNRHEPYKHFRDDEHARQSWFAHRDELLGERDPDSRPYSSHLHVAAGLERFEEPVNLLEAAHTLADELDLEYRAVVTAAHAVWLVGAGLLDPAWIDEALSRDERPAEQVDDDLQRRVGTGHYLAEALRTLLVVAGPWKVQAWAAQGVRRSSRC